LLLADEARGCCVKTFAPEFDICQGSGQLLVSPLATARLSLTQTNRGENTQNPFAVLTALLHSKLGFLYQGKIIYLRQRLEFIWIYDRLNLWLSFHIQLTQNANFLNYFSQTNIMQLFLAW